MNCVFKNAAVFTDGRFQKTNISVINGKIASIGEAADDTLIPVECEGFHIFPGFFDVHVHLREPGFSYKETIASGTAAAARGGYTDVCSMPNLNPVPDCPESLKAQLDIIAKSAVIGVHPYGAITVGELGKELSDMDGLAKNCIAFSDDGRGVQSAELMEAAMKKAKLLNKLTVAHCEDNSLLHGGCIHDGEFARANGFKGICSESEWGPVKRDIELAEKTGCAYHVCHISAAETVELIRKAKARGVNITCETAPHYLTLDDSMLRDEGRFKMNPPIRSAADRAALIEGIKDGTIDMIATDHAPHSAEEKSKGLEGSLMGVVGLETAFPVCYTKLVKTGIITLERLIELLCLAPRKRFGVKSEISVGSDADFTIFDLEKKYRINPDEFLTKGRATPFEGEEVFGECIMTVAKGKTVWTRK